VTGRRMDSINLRNRVVEAAKRGECYSLIAQREGIGTKRVGQIASAAGTWRGGRDSVRAVSVLDAAF